ncbi:hypothetical protein LTR97_012577 [Elasticomyces elasticus]|uniref:Uncharacterized protein n=1 Tax=Elasticomyces elasticus TaxID=574655 RepID=A0AAN7VWI0_9PEZI|nr:hypothetical protein LTR97_012577 [Elasticomyces elasticus]
MAPQLRLLDLETGQLAPFDLQKTSFTDTIEVIDEKSTTSISVTSSAPRESAKSSSIGTRLSRWAQPRPITGLLTLLVVFGCVLFTAAILIASNKRPVDKWIIQPTVYLAIATAVANSALSYAFTQAAVVAWFYRASKGTTILGLERTWEASYSVVHAISQGRNTSLVAIAAILVALMIVDGPLLQRSSTVVVATQSNMMTVNFTLTPEVPKGLSGLWQFQNIIISNAAIQVGQDFTLKSPIALAVNPPCLGLCAAKLLGPGVVKTNCSTKSWPITKSMYFDPNATWGSQGAQGDLFYWPEGGRKGINPFFYVSVNYHYREPKGSATYQSEGTMLRVARIDLRNSSGTYTETSCWLLPAVLEYDVQFDDVGHVKVLSDTTSTARPVALANNTLARDDSPQHLTLLQSSTIDWFTMYLEMYAGSFVEAYLLDNGSVWASNFGTVNAQSLKYTNYLNNTNPLDVAWYDPTTDMMNDMNDMMFRAAVLSSSWANLSQLIDPGLSAEQSVIANQTVTQNVYHADFRWYAAATALEILVALAVLPLFWGWWTLNRHISFSPISFGLALNAPLLRELDPAEGSRGAIKQLGQVHVRYGVVVEGGSGRHSIFDGDHKRLDNVNRVGIAESRYVVAT